MNAGVEQRHVAGEHDELHAARLEPVGDRGVAGGAVGVVGALEHAGLEPGPLRALERARRRGGRWPRATISTSRPWTLSISAWRFVPPPDARTPTFTPTLARSVG